MGFKSKLANCSKKEESLKRFFDLLDKHKDKIEETRNKMEDIYAFKTPQKPCFEYGVTSGFDYQKSIWVANDFEEGLDYQMQLIELNLELLPFYDYVPYIMLNGGFGELIPGMFGLDFDVTPEGAIINKNFYVEDIDDIEEKVEKLPEINVLKFDSLKKVLKQLEFILKETKGKLDITYPQMQGPFSNLVRLVPQEDALCATAIYPEAMKSFVNKVWRVGIDIQKEIIKTAGDSNALRVRHRFYQPKWIKGLVVEDYISVLNPEVFYELTKEAYDTMFKEIGPIFQHTCGPVLQSAEIIKKLPGLIGFETAFIRNQSKTTSDLEEIKKALGSKVVINSFDLPFGEAVQDEENLSLKWIKKISEGGGFAMRAAGSIQKGRELAKKIGLEDI